MTPAFVSTPLTLFVNPSPPCSLGFAPYSLVMVASSQPKPMASKPQSPSLSLSPPPSPCPVPQHGALLIRPPPWSTVLPRPLCLQLASVSSSLWLLLLPGVRCDPRPPLSISGLPGMTSPTPWAYQAASTPSPAQTWPLSSRSDSKSPWGPPHPPHSWAPSFFRPHPHLTNLLHGPL